jgi:hypothetical protein
VVVDNYVVSWKHLARTTGSYIRSCCSVSGMSSTSIATSPYHAYTVRYTYLFEINARKVATFPRGAGI